MNLLQMIKSEPFGGKTISKLDSVPNTYSFSGEINMDIYDYDIFNIIQ